MTDYQGFRSLIVWQKSQALALAVVEKVAKLPRNRSSESIGNQLVRSAGSVAANIAEGYGRFSPGAFRNHLSIARGSLFETESWIDLLFKSGYLSEGENRILIDQCNEVGRLLTSRMKELDRSSPLRIREEGVRYTSEDLEEAR